MHPQRILTIDLRSRLFGFAVFEAAGTLLDCGMRMCLGATGNENAMMAHKKVVALIERFAASGVVLKYTSGPSDKPLLKKKRAIAAIKHETRQRSISLVLLTRKDISKAFLKSGKNKYEIAALIAGLYPETAWRLPPIRKNYDPEHYNMTIFDAISLGLTYFAQSEEPPG